MGQVEVRDGEVCTQQLTVTRQSFVRPIATAMLSLLVLVGVASFVLGTTSRYAFATTGLVTKIGSRYDVYYGKVTDNSGHPLANFRVQIYHLRNSHKVIDKTLYSNKSGL